MVLFLAAVAGTAAAQSTTGSIQGDVVDQTGRPVTGAQVVVTSDATGARLSTRTDDDGRFVVPAVAPGAYQVQVSQSGFRQLIQTVLVGVNQARHLRLELQSGPVTELVIVRPTDVPMDPLTPSLRVRIEPDEVRNLPLDGRNFLDLALLVPGAVPAAEGSAGSVRGEFAFNVHGAREDANAYLLDGVYNFDPELNSAAVRPPVEAVREFEVLTSLPDASFGRSSGAQVNVVTQSGTNRFAGSAFDFMRTAAFNARNHFAPDDEPAPEYGRHQFGLTMGGPIVRDRAFFFADYEGTRLDEGITRVTTVPTLAERQGDFSASLLPAPINPFTQQPFQDRRIPDVMQHPVGRAIAALYPEPNRGAPFANFVSSPTLEEDVNQFDVRTDVRANRLSITSRFSFSDRQLFEPFAGPSFSLVPGYGNDVPRRAANLAVSAFYQLGNGLSNEARLGWTRVSSAVRQQGLGTSLNRQVGLPELSDQPRDWGLSLISVTGFSPIGHEFNNPQESTTNMWQFSDTVHWTRGRHQLKFGGDLRLLRQEAFRDVQARGLLQFTNQAFTGNALADLLLGLPSVTVGARVDNPQDLRTHSYALFAQDTMRLTGAVTLSAGLRYDFHAPPVDAEDRVTLYDPAIGQVVPVGTESMPRGGYVPDRNNVAPRLGAAWAVRPATVVRGGYGISYDQAALAPNEFLYFNAPFFDLSTFFSLQNPPYLLTLSDPFPADFPVPLPDSATTVQRDLRSAYLHDFNVSVQQQFGGSRLVEIAYVGSRGRNLVAARDINQPTPSLAPFVLRPNPLFADIMAIESRARSEYNALELRLEQRLDRGAAFSAAYTLGKSMDDASGFFASAGDANFPMDSNNPAAEWARSNFDVRHRLMLHGSWELPFGPDRRWLNRGAWALCFGNWDLYGVLAMHSGRPFTPAVHPDLDISNTGRANLGFGANDRPDLVGDPSVPSPGPDRWFNPDAYALPAFGTFGDAGRNSLDGPGYRNVNLALTRRVPLRRGVFQLRLEIFNAFNWTNFDQPGNFLGLPTFGQILSAGAPRRMQLGLRYGW
jgi:hypothetical protein